MKASQAEILGSQLQAIVGRIVLGRPKALQALAIPSKNLVRLWLIDQACIYQTFSLLGRRLILGAIGDFGIHPAEVSREVMVGCWLQRQYWGIKNEGDWQ